MSKKNLHYGGEIVMQKDRKEGKGNNISVTQRVLDKFGDNATHDRRSSCFDSFWQIFGIPN